MAYIVSASGLCKSFGGRLVLDHIDLAVHAGSVFALLGPNGAGKSTMVRILAPLLRPDAGTATVAGHDLRTDPVGVKRAISLTGQHVAIDDVLTGQENLEMVASLRHLPRRTALARIDELLAEFDLTTARDRRASTYSGGMQRRLDLAISLLVPPRLLFLDEPTTGLDPRSREQLWSTVRRIIDGGVSVFLTTQYLEEADQLADSVAVLDHGRVVAHGTPDELKSSLGAEVVRLRFATAETYRDALATVDPVDTDERLYTIEVATGGSAGDVLELLRRLEYAGAPAARVSTHRPSLEDVYLSLTGPAAYQEVAS